MNENNVTENLQESEKCNPTEDLKLIDRTMSVSKYNQGDIAWLMTMCGGLMLILFSSLNIFDSSIDLSTSDMNIYLAPSLYCGLLFVLLIAGLLRRFYIRKVKSGSDLFIYDMWMIALIIMPLITQLIQVIFQSTNYSYDDLYEDAKYSHEQHAASLLFLHSLRLFKNVSFALTLIYTGVRFKSIFMIVVSVMYYTLACMFSASKASYIDLNILLAISILVIGIYQIPIGKSWRRKDGIE